MHRLQRESIQEVAKQYSISADEVRSVCEAVDEQENDGFMTFWDILEVAEERIAEMFPIRNPDEGGSHV